MALSQQVKLKANELADKGQWLRLAIMILQYGLELIEYLKQRKKEKNEGKDNN